MKMFGVVLILLLSSQLNANNLKINSPQWDYSSGIITFDVTWDNSWRDATGKFRDAVWVFVKYRSAGGQWTHAKIELTGSSPVGMTADEPTDQMGAFLTRSGPGNGTVQSGTWAFQVLTSASLLGPNPDFKVFGIEMVFIPSGNFYLGGSLSSSTSAYAHRGDSNDDGLLITSEASITHGNTSSDFNTSNESFGYNLDIPATYPKGFNSIYCMKYELTQQQYVDFLNTLTAAQQENRTQTIDLSTPYAMATINQTTVTGRNAIRYIGLGSEGNYQFACDYNENGIIGEIDDGRSIACNFLNSKDLRAYLDWSALRPMSSLEVFKICRGPLLPVEDEYAYGSPFSNTVSSSELINQGRSNEIQSNPELYPQSSLPMRSGFAATTSSDRWLSGATYYGVMEMSGSVMEMVVDFEDSADLLFTGSLGDGILTASGENTNTDWSLAGKRLSAGRKLDALIGGSGTTNARSPANGGRGVRQF